MGACIIRINDRKYFGKILRYSKDRKAYLVEIKKTKSVQWLSESLVETRYNVIEILK